MELLIGAHDPGGRKFDQVPTLKPTLELFSSAIVSVTPTSVTGVARNFERFGVPVIEGSQNPHETQLELLNASSENIFSIALDRLLHMQSKYPNELKMASKLDPAD